MKKRHARRSEYGKAFPVPLVSAVFVAPLRDRLVGLRDLIRDLSEKGATVLLTTHYMEEADELCDHVAFLSAGKIVALDTPRELKLKRAGQRTATVVLENREEHIVALDDGEDARRLEGWMSDGQVAAVRSNEGTLEDVFIELAGRPL